MIDAVRYLVDNGIKWRAMPADFPPWPRVYAFFARWRDTGLVTELHERLREAVRRSQGRAPEPSAAVVDSQSVKADATVALGSRGFDAGKKINGRQRHLLTDTLGLLLSVLVTPASTTDRDGARTLLPTATGRFRRLVREWADGRYTGPSTRPRHRPLVARDRSLPPHPHQQRQKRRDQTRDQVRRPRRLWLPQPDQPTPRARCVTTRRAPDTSAPHNFEDPVY
ncbi:transposase [Streptomyces umbrinus]|uniref:Transposase n=1 Tax=Streptomyces umbrinus TaxID=67370 RepID=A0ABU0SGX8_9ACTN|nr:transposase [Streptomyces umbrinus]